MTKNEVIQLECTALGSNMEGVCHYEGKVIFVPGLLPGESSPVQIVKIQDRYSFGRIAGPVISPSRSRRECDCSSFPKCGGCTARHMCYEETLNNKKSMVEQCFHSISHMDIDLPPVLGMDSPFHYRNKSSFPVGGTKGHPVLGFYAPRSHRIIPVSSCVNAMEPTDDICREFLDWVTVHNLVPYDEETNTGLLRHLIIRVNHVHQVMVILVATAQRIPYIEELISRLTHFNVCSLIVNVNKKQTNVILGDSYHTVYGEDHISDQISGLDFDLSPASFFQVNREQAEKIYSLAISFSGTDKNSTVYDVYCGTGTISLLAARSCKKVIGIEYVEQAVINARKNAVRNHLTNTEFFAGKAEDLLPYIIEHRDAPDIMIVDPPRKGLDPSVIQTMCGTGVSDIIYVSCNPATLARDTVLIQSYGYSLTRIQSVDMFCWTSDVETVAKFSRC